MKKTEKRGNGEFELKMKLTNQRPTLPLRASAASDVGSDTFGHFGPESYLPPEEKGSDTCDNRKDPMHDVTLPPMLLEPF